LPLIYVLIGVYVAGAIIYAMMRDRKEKTATAGPNNLYALVRLATYPIGLAGLVAFVVAILAAFMVAIPWRLSADLLKWIAGRMHWLADQAWKGVDAFGEMSGDVIDFYID
jgi:hypothetical protein